MNRHSRPTISSTAPSGQSPRFASRAGAFPIAGCAILAASLFSGCGGGSPAPIVSENAGALVAQPDLSIGSDVFIGEASFGGYASILRIRGVSWGRLASVADSSGIIRLRDFVIADSIRDQTPFVASDGTTLLYGLSRNAVTDATVVTIPAALGSTAFSDALMHLEANLTPVFDKGLEADETGPFSMVPRNSAIVIRFDDLLEPHFANSAWRDQSGGDVVNELTGQLNKDLVKISTGYPPQAPFETRIIADPNHGNLADRDGDGVSEYYPTRVIISSTVSTIDAQISNPPLPINAVGLPPSIVLDSANMALRMPTLDNPSVGQIQFLRNASLKPLSLSSNGSTSDDQGTPDVVRALRTGGSLTGDANNGFLLDEDPPSILGDLEVLVSSTPVVDDPMVPDRYRIPQLGFSVTDCAAAPKLGDVIAQNAVRAQVVDVGSQNGPVITDMVVDVIAPQGGVMLAGGARLQTPFVLGVDNPPCFISYSPIPATPPNIGVDPAAKVVLRFSEPMDPATLRPFDTFTVTRIAGEPTPYDYVVGQVVPAADLRAFSFEHPGVPFAHQMGFEENYFVNLSSGVSGPTDLAGNPLVEALPQSNFALRSIDESSVNAGFAMRFDTADEFGNDGQFELRNGQLLYDPVNERILPRPVSRFDVAADRNQPLPSVMTQFVGGIQTPLSKLGSKLQAVWRYVDVGFSLTDETNINMDIEGLSWAPVGASVVTDAYEEFAIILAHSEWLPDEILDPMSGFPAFPNSGLKPVYANNLNDATNDPGTTVHPKPEGYVVNPSNLYTASSGTSMLPYPLNQEIALEDYRYYTWRDTALTAVGGPNNAGAILAQESAVVYGGDPAAGNVYTTGNIPTVGLPLLMEFRCYPSDEALGLNALDISLAANSSARPNFRAFSTGGYDNNNIPNFVDPDLETDAAGGFNPNSNPPGNSTSGTDNSFYIGEMALVTRVSRVHTVWFDTTFPRSTFVQPVIEPEASLQPGGTQVVLAYRGASQIGGQSGDDITNNAANLDVYGDPVGIGVGNPTFIGAGDWVEDITEINEARYFQLRISFISNGASNQTAELQSLGFSFFDATAN